ncbi:MAG: hypothetical protein SGILL_000952 [Bacillariaceae sp.]
MNKSNKTDKYHHPLPKEEAADGGATKIVSSQQVKVTAATPVDMTMKPKSQNYKKKQHNNSNDLHHQHKGSTAATKKKKNQWKNNNQQDGWSRASESGDETGQETTQASFHNGFNNGSSTIGDQPVNTGAEWMKRINQNAVNIQGIIYSFNGEIHYEFAPNDGTLYKLATKKATKANQREQKERQQPQMPVLPPMVPGFVCQQGVPVQEGIVMGQYGYTAGYPSHYHNGSNMNIPHPDHPPTAMMQPIYQGYYQYPTQQQQLHHLPNGGHFPVHGSFFHGGGDESIHGNSSDFDGDHNRGLGSLPPMNDLRIDDSNDGAKNGQKRGSRRGNTHKARNGKGPPSISPMP